MRKSLLAALLLLAATATTQIGCRACSNCLDYGSPVAGAACGGCQECRSGSCYAGEPTVPEGVSVAQQPSGDTRMTK